MWHTTKVTAIFIIFLPVFAKIWLPWQRPLDPCKQKCLLWIGWPSKPPVISNHILVISCRNAFICIYSHFSPNIDCHGNAALSLVYGSVTIEFADTTNCIWKPNCMDMLHTTEVMAILWYFLPIWAKIWLPWQRLLDSCSQKCLLWIGRPPEPYHRTKNFVNSCYTSEVMSYSSDSNKTPSDSKVHDRIGNFRCFAINMENQGWPI